MRWYLALGIWILFNLWQAAFTGLDADEAYYWMYAQRLDWGYFDHPPFVALLIRLGNFLGGELGLRLGHVLISGLGWWGLWILVDKPKQGPPLLTLLALLLSLPMLQIYGFIATPDGPLLCATVWFFLAYRHFIKQANWSSALFFGLSMSLLLYAKYHGLLVIGFTVLSNRKLWLSPRFYAASIFGALLFLPHLYWQYSHDFPSFRYHLVGRGDVYQIKHTIQYILNQLVVAGPLVFPLVFYALFALKRPGDQLVTAFRWMCIGFWLFFFYSTFKGSTEAQWTAVLSIAFVYTTYHFAQDHLSFRKWVIRLGLISTLIFVLLRLWLALDFIPLPSQLAKQFEHREWTRQIADIAGDRTVVFSNSYRDPSLFKFYTGHDAWTFTDSEYRPNQYDLWPDGLSLHNKDVLYIGHYEWSCPGGENIIIERRRYGLCNMTELQVIRPLQIKWRNMVPWLAGSVVAVELNIYNASGYSIQLQQAPAPLQLAMLIHVGTDNWQHIDIELPQGLKELKRGNTLLTVKVPLPLDYVGEFPISFGFNYKGLFPMVQSPLQDIVILPSRQ